MLYIDGISLNLLKNELSDELKNRKLTKIFQYDKYNISLFFGKLNLYISTNPSLPVLYIAANKEEAPDVPIAFSLSLRKFILNSILISISQHQNDRIIILTFEKLDELGDRNTYNLIFEIMGKHSNLFLCDSQFKIIDLLKKLSLDENNLRTLLQGMTYSFPVISQKKSPFEVDIDYFSQNIFSEKDIIKNIEGFGKLTAQEINTDFDIFSEFLKKSACPTIYFDNNKIKIAAFLELKSYQNLNSLKFDKINDLINYYIENTITSNQYTEISNKLLKTIKDNIEKTKKIIKLIEKDIDSNKNYEKFKEIGDILAANLYNIKYIKDKITLFDFYNNNDIDINLNTTISITENLNNYYKKYNKCKRAEKFNIERKQFLLNELLYLESILSFIENAENIDSLKLIEDELVENKYIKASIRRKKNKNSNSLQQFISVDGYEVTIGRNNKENDFITFKYADKNDIWFHAKDIPGSHVIIKTNSKPDDVPQSSIIQAAQVAAFFSKGKNDTKSEIDYTLVKYVKKPNGSKPGFVIYTNQSSINVEPKRF